MKKLIITGALVAAAGISLTACGTTHTIIIKAAPSVTHTVTAAPTPKAAAPKAAPKPSATTAPAPVKTVIVHPAPAKTVYVQAPAPHAGNGLVSCGTWVSAGAGTSCSFAYDVAQAYESGPYWNQPGTSYFTVDGEFMTSASVGNPVVVTDGNGDLVQFNH